MTSKLIFLFLFLFIYPPLSHTEDNIGDNNNWILKKNEEGISVYTRTSETSALKELKAVTQVKASLSSIVALLNDWDSYPKWVYRCTESKTFKKISETDLIHYQTIVAPWPADDRDFVVSVKLSQDPKTKTVIQKSSCIPDYIPHLTNHVRISEFKASWTLSPLNNGYVNIEYQLMVDPGGNIPVWLVNMAMVEGPYQTLFQLKQWVTKEVYQKRKFSFIQEME